MSTAREGALLCATRSWRVFPIYGVVDGKCECGKADCSSPAKHPRTSDGFKSATSDRAEIERWFEKWPNGNFGVATGAVSGVMVIDIDPPDGHASLEKFEAEHGVHRGGLWVATPRGGKHLYFVYVEGVKNSANYLGKNIDVRGDGGYVLGGGSVGIQGPYTELDGPLVPISPLAWRPFLLKQQKPGVQKESRNPGLSYVDKQRRLDLGCTRYGRVSLDNQCAKLAAAPEGTRNSTLNTCALSIGHLVGGGEIEEATARFELTRAAKACGLGDAEIAKTLESGLTAGMREPQKAPPLKRDRARSDDRWGPDPGGDRATAHHSTPLSATEQEDPPEGPEEPPEETIKELSVELLLPPGPPPDEFVRRLIVRPGIHVVFGPPQSGKSIALLAAMLDAVEGGGSFCSVDELEIRPKKDECVLWAFGNEDTMARQLRRARKLRESGPYRDKPFPADRFFTGEPPAGMALNTPQGKKWLERQIVRTKASIVVLDTITSLCLDSLDPNKAEQVGPFLAWLLDLRKRYNLIIFLVHHTRKASTDPKKSAASHADALLGAQTWRALSESVVEFNAKDGNTLDTILRCHKAKDVDNPIPTIRLTMERDTARFRHMDDEEEAPAAESVKRGGRPRAADIGKILPLRIDYPDGIPWGQIRELLEINENTWRNNSSSLQAALLKLGHVVVGGTLKWSTES